MHLAECLADFALGPVAASQTAARMIRLSCLDWAVCGIAGAGEPVATILRKDAMETGGSAEATLIGGGRGPAGAAALVNGATSHALDYDDTHFAHIGHPSVAVFPAALALAERAGLGLSAMLDAALIGAEASIRVGLWLGRGHYQAGFHQTATAGAFGATLTSGRLLDLSPDQMGYAIGIAATKAAGLKSQFGTMGKPLNAGLAAECGVMAAIWAGTGMVSTPLALDGPQGFGPTHHGAGDIAAFDGLGEVWHFETVSHKFHACCHGLHAMLEALRQAPDDPERVVIHTHPRWMSVCNIVTPETGLEAKFSYRMAAAMALAGLDTGRVESFSDEVVGRADLRELQARIEVLTDESLSEMQARIEVTGSGRTISLFHDLAAPITLSDRADRVRQKAAGLLGADRAAALEEAIQGDDLSALTALFGA